MTTSSIPVAYPGTAVRLKSGQYGHVTSIDGDTRNVVTVGDEPTVVTAHVDDLRPLPRVLGYQTLHRQVLAVYVAGSNLDFACYVVPVPGISHSEEARAHWQADGQKQSAAMARGLHPTMWAWLTDEVGLTYRD